MARIIGNTLICLLVAFFAINVLASIGQDFGFPEVGDGDKAKQNSDNKKPVYLPQQCNENELFYPGDQKDDWVCDCKPGFIYYPKTDRCYGAYRQGPCQRNEFLTIPTGNYIPECTLNKCYLDGLVSFKNACHLLDKAGPCDLPELSYVVSVNSLTLEVECIRQTQPDLSSRFGEDGDESNSENRLNTTCLKGSKRSVLGKC